MDVTVRVPLFSNLFLFDRETQMKDKDFYPSMQNPVKEGKTNYGFEAVRGTKKADFA